MLTLYLISAAFTSSMINGLVGMAGGVTLLAAMTLVLPLEVILPIHGIVLLVSMSSRALFLFDDIARPFCYPFWAGAPLGGVFGYLLLRQIERPTWLYGLIALLLFYVALKPKTLPEVRLRSRGFFILGTVAACVGCLVGATGPLITPFFLRTDLSKEATVATRAACQSVVNLIKLPVFWSLSFDYGAYSPWIVWMAVAVVIGNKLGTVLLRGISNEKFAILTKIAILCIATRLLYKSGPVYWSLISSPWATPSSHESHAIHEPVAPPPHAASSPPAPDAPPSHHSTLSLLAPLPAPTPSDITSRPEAKPKRDAAKTAWERVKTSEQPHELIVFMLMHPDSRFAPSALMRFQHLQRQWLVQVQLRLTEVGLDPGPADGIFGPRTQAALRRFQHRHVLPVTGQLDPVTLERLQIRSNVVEPVDSGAAAPMIGPR